MLILFDFECEICDHVFEALVDREVKETDCPECGRNAVRKISPVRSKLDGTDPGFPGAYDKWARDHIKRGGMSEAAKDQQADEARRKKAG